jgi:hypothetical protein
VAGGAMGAVILLASSVPLPLVGVAAICVYVVLCWALRTLRLDDIRLALRLLGRTPLADDARQVPPDDGSVAAYEDPDPRLGRTVSASGSAGASS